MTDTESTPEIELTDSAPVEDNVESTEPQEIESEEQPQEKTKEQKRIDKLIYEKYEAKRQADQTRYENEQLRQAILEINKGNPNANPDDIQQLVKLEAQKIAAETTFNEACNKVYERGAKEFKDFDRAVENLQLVGVTRDFLELVADSDVGEKVLNHYGSNLEEAEILLSMPPLKMAREFAKLEQKLASQKKSVSNAPKPISTITSTGKKGVIASSDMSDEDYAKWRKSGR